MFSSTSHLISSLARHLGKNLLVCLIHPCSVQLWYLGMQHSLHPGGTFGPVYDGQNLPSPGSLKLLNGVEEREVRGKEKRHHSRMGVKPRLWLHWEWWNATLLHVITYNWQVVSHLSPFSGTSLWCKSSKISHLCRSALFHTRSAQRAPLLLYIIWSCDWKNLNTWVRFLDGNQLYIFLHNFNQLFLISNGIKYRGHICVSIHNMNSCSLWL